MGVAVIAVAVTVLVLVTVVSTVAVDVICTVDVVVACTKTVAAVVGTRSASILLFHLPPILQKLTRSNCGRRRWIC